MLFLYLGILVYDRLYIYIDYIFLYIFNILYDFCFMRFQILILIKFIKISNL